MKRNPRRLTRREFLLGATTLLGGAVLSEISYLLARAAEGSSTTYLPLVNNDGNNTPKPPTVTPTKVGATVTPTPTGVTPTSTSTAPTSTPITPVPPGPLDGRVVHIRDEQATNWNGSDPFYNAVDQSVVNAMTLSGLQDLTGQTGWSAIWNLLFNRIHSGGYSQGQKIAIKVNFNNSGRDTNNCSSHNNYIDALHQPVIALIQGMVAAGVVDDDIIIYDATTGTKQGFFPSYFRVPILAAYPGVSFIGKSDCDNTDAPTFGKDPSLTVHFNNPQATKILDRQLPDVLYDATYLINMPIIKKHSSIPVSLAFKNHFGSIDYVNGGPTSDELHEYIEAPSEGTLYDSDYSPYVDIYNNPNIRNKTVLTVGDALFGAFGVVSTAQRNWDIFGGGAKSLLFATDPVAIDCVMCDLLRAEGIVGSQYTYDYLFCADTAGLGLCEGSRADPGGDPLQLPYGSGYSTLTYIRQDL